MTHPNQRSTTDMFSYKDIGFRPVEITNHGMVAERLNNPEICETFSHERLAELQNSPNFRYYPKFFSRDAQLNNESLDYDSIGEMDFEDQALVLWSEAVVKALIKLHADGKIKLTETDYHRNLSLIAVEVNSLDGQDYSNRKKRRAGAKLESRALPCARTALEWRRTYIRAGYNPVALLPKHKRSGNRNRRWCIDTERYALRVIDHYCAEKISKPKAVFRTLDDIKAENERREQNGEPLLTVPSRRAIFDRLRLASPYRVCARREGIDAANRKFNLYETGVDVEEPLERVEMDGCKLDLISVFSYFRILDFLPPERRKALERGRRWLYAAIDCRTKVILALRLAENPSADVAVKTLRDVYSDKSDIAAACGCDGSWHEGGPVGELVTDQGPEFYSVEFRAAASALGTTLRFPPAGMPWMRGQIERYFKNLGHQLLPLLSGRTGFSPKDRGDYPSKEMACLTDDELIQLIVRFVVDVYHNEPHSSLGGETPKDCWERLTQQVPPPALPDGQAIRFAFGRKFVRTIKGNGVTFADIGYSCDALKEAFIHSPNRTAEICVDLRDLGWIMVKVGDSWHPARSNVPGMDGVSHDQLKEAKRALSYKYRAQAELNVPIIRKALSDISDVNRAAMRRMELTPFHTTDEEIERNEGTFHFSLRTQTEIDNPDGHGLDPLSEGILITPPARDEHSASSKNAPTACDASTNTAIPASKLSKKWTFDND